MSPAPMRMVSLPSGEAVPALGQGTWYFGEDPRRRKEEVAALRTGFELGMTLVDTAEMYGNGASEELVGEAIAGHRAEIFLVSKVLPHHATASGTVAACEASLRRLDTDRLDLYLLHWRGSIELEETLEGFARLQDAGKIRYWGVSNFDTSDIDELRTNPDGLDLATNQVLYNLSRRSIEYDLIPQCEEQGIPIMAYSPVEQGRLLDQPALKQIAARHGATTAQTALAWVLRLPNMIAIPRARAKLHVMENRDALDVRLSEADLAELDRAFPPPRQKQPLEMI